jgi:signal transduction histidine kinase
MRRRWARRAGCLFVAFVLLVVFVVGTLIWATVTALDGSLGVVLVGLGWVVVIGLVGRFVVGRLRGAFAPLGDLVEASERIEAGEVGTQVQVRGPGEVRSLARAFNSMSSRLADDSEARRHLLADVSHELRTPLAVIQGNVEAMIDGVYPADREHLERILGETRHLERLIEDLRTLSLADAGELSLHREPVNLDALATEVVAGFRAGAEGSGVALELDLGGVPELDLDPQRMRQVVGNLVTNALRHTTSGRVRVVTRRIDGGVELAVVDTGRGMDPATAERAFDRFYRSGDQGGAGLGLAIVRDLVQAHGGEVTLESAAGAGTTVRCRFPAG